jgi:outer membrane protein assembly factor BamB
MRIVSVSLIALLALGACAEREVILPGERFDVRADLAASIPTEADPNPTDTSGQIANLSAPISLPPQTANADWTHRAGGVRHLSPHGSLSSAPQRVFSVNIGQGNSRRNRISAAPIVAGGKVFTLDATATLAATSTGGQSLWQTDLTPVTDRAS